MYITLSKKKKRFLLTCGFFLALNGSDAYSQSKLYPNEFDLSNVTLLPGKFKDAMDLNIKVLMEYDMDRLLEPYYKQAGLNNGASAFSNWAGLDGHVGGHYLSALAIHYAATHDLNQKQMLKARLDQMIAELKICQDAFGNVDNSLKGYLGGIPNSKTIWTTFKNGNFTAYNSAWVAWYNIHKMYAGLRDAWLYGESEIAKEMFFDYCDWGINITSGLTDAQMESMLGIEHGGMNEIYADAYQLTGDKKYLTAAKRFTHKYILNGCASKNTSFLNNQHANTQVPKAIGIQRIYELDPSETTYKEAASFFWEDVVNNRSLALGGNSRSEYFIAPSACGDYVTSREGPESCNTYNMLKLSENLFRLDQNGEFADFYEQALFNHILSTQHPEHGGYVYFTSARPRHYRVYSDVNKAMWCCVGSGMENHGKYGHFIYTHKGDSLFVNLFISSELNWKEKDVKIRQETDFPYQQSTTLKIESGKSSKFPLVVRYPSWCKETNYQITVNGESIEYNVSDLSYVTIEREWKNGDEVNVSLPMKTHFTELPNVPEYIALMHGPILLGAKTGTEDLDGLVAGEARMDHIAYGKNYALNEAPIIVFDREALADQVKELDRSKFTFTAPALFEANYNNTYKDLVLEPFFNIHDSRYMMYWMQLTENEYKTIYDELAKIEADKLELENKTVDQIATGEQQPDSDHNMKGVNTYNGTYQDIYYRDARNGGWFSYDMNTQNVDTLILRATYWGAENGLRTFHIIVDGDTIAEENVSNKWNVSDFVDVDYEIPVNLTEGKSKINVKFDAMSGNTAGGIYHLRLYEDVGRGSKKYYEEASVTEINTGTVSSEKNFNYKTLNSSTGTHKNETWRDCNNGGYIKYTIPVNDSDSMKLRVRYWGNEGYEREFDIKVDGTVVATEKINGKWNTDAFQNVDYEIPVSLVKDKESVEVSFEPKSNNYAGGLFYLWMHGYKEVNESTALNSYKKDIFSVSIENGSIVINNKESNGKIKIFDLKGNLIYSSQIEKHLSINSDGFMKNNTYLIMYSDKEITQVKKLNIN